MKLLDIKYIIAGITVLALFTTSCKKGCTDPNAINYDDRAKKMDNSCEYEEEPPTAPINLKIYHMLDGQSFAFNQDFTDDFGNKCSFTRAQMYLSNPIYLDDQMDTIATPEAYVLVSPDENAYSFGSLTGQPHVHMMNLLVGVDATANVSDPAGYDNGHALAYQSPSTHWNWNSGYIFIAIEGKVDVDGNGTYDAGEDFLMHVGTDDMAREVNSLMAHFNVVEGMEHNIELDLNWAELVAGIDLKTENSSHTMGNVPLATKVADNSVNAITIH